MTNPYQTPRSSIDDINTAENTSGMGKGHPLPAGIAGWGWGPFMWNWLWSAFNGTWIGLLALIPYVGFAMSIVLGVKGREWAWQNKRWESVEHFNRVQRKWSIAAAILVLVILAGIVAALLIPALNGH